MVILMNLIEKKLLKIVYIFFNYRGYWWVWLKILSNRKKINLLGIKAKVLITSLFHGVEAVLSLFQRFSFCYQHWKCIANSTINSNMRLSWPNFLLSLSANMTNQTGYKPPLLKNNLITTWVSVDGCRHISRWKLDLSREYQWI